MPLTERIELGDALMLVWRIDESEDELRGKVNAKDIESVDVISSSKRRVGRLAWRAALRKQFGDENVSYDEYCAPIMSGGCLSVSHCEGLAVALVSARGCGVDVESVDRDLSKVRSKFVSLQEEMLEAAGEPMFEVVVWCAKEAIYKRYRRKKLSLKEDIRVLAVDVGKGEVKGEVKGVELMTVHILRLGSYVVAYTI